MLFNYFEQFELVHLISIFSFPIVTPVIYLVLMGCGFGLIYVVLAPHLLVCAQGFQTVMELIFEFLYGLVKSQLGSRGMVFFPVIAFLFLWIVGLNLLGMFPFGFTVTSHVATTGGLALGVFVGIQLIGLVIQKIKFFQLFLPAGTPMWLVPVLPLMEFISYSFRVFSLAIRLIANMTSGHLLIHIFAGFSWQMLIQGGILLVLFPIAFALVFFLTGLEMAISCLQGYVFTILVSIYLVDVIYGHGD